MVFQNKNCVDKTQPIIIGVDDCEPNRGKSIAVEPTQPSYSADINKSVGVEGQRSWPMIDEPLIYRKVFDIIGNTLSDEVS